MDGWTDGPTDIRSPPPIPPPASAALSDFEAEETNSREKRERILRKLFLLLRDLTYLYGCVCFNFDDKQFRRKAEKATLKSFLDRGKK